MSSVLNRSLFALSTFIWLFYNAQAAISSGGFVRKHEVLNVEEIQLIDYTEDLESSTRLLIELEDGEMYLIDGHSDVEYYEELPELYSI